MVELGLVRKGEEGKKKKIGSLAAVEKGERRGGGG